MSSSVDRIKLGSFKVGRVGGEWSDLRDADASSSKRDDDVRDGNHFDRGGMDEFRKVLVSCR